MEEKLKTSRWLYTVQAAVEYFISILVSGSFLATLTGSLGMEDSLTGILSSIISLGCLFQLISMLFRRNRVKRFVILLSVINQMLFLFLYVVPMIPLGNSAKSAIFAVMIVLAYLTYNIAHPKKISWLMSLVEDGQRGRFTANKEIISLISGMAVSWGMGAVMDHFREAGELRTALIIGACTLFGLMIWNTLLLVFTVEPETDAMKKPALGLRKSFSELMKNKRIRSVIVIFALYNIAHYAAIPFYGTYLINEHELNLGLTTVALLSMLGSVARVLVSRFWGSYADRRSFAAMIEKCLLIMAVSYVCVAFAVPQNGIYMFALYNVFHGIAMGGVNSALTNMVFDYVPHESRSDSLAICQAVAGVIGFITTLCMSPVVSAIQKNGNSVLGIPLYAQQFVTLIGLIMLIVTVLFVRFTILKKRKEKES